MISTSDNVKSFSQQDTALEDPLINNGMSNTDKFKNSPDGSNPPQECNRYKHEGNNGEQNEDNNSEEVYDKETSEDENEQSNEEQNKENNNKTNDNRNNEDIDDQLFGKNWEKDKVIILMHHV